MYEAVKNKVHEAGEIMIRMDSGSEHELHKHNVEFHDDTHLAKVDADDEIHWVNLDCVERFWIHKEF